MNRNAKVTIGLCVKNAEATIAYAMKGIMNQDFPRELMELIVVDGYSKDNTLKIIERILNGTISSRTIFENKGLGVARQIVVDNASGEYIVWVDGDIVLAKNHVSKQVEFMDNHPNVGIGRSRYGIWPESGPVAFLENIPFVVESSKFEGNVPVTICGAEGSIHRVRAIRQVGGFDIGIKGAAEDIDLASRILAAGWPAHTTDAFFYELCRDSWRDLWKEYTWWGRGGHYAFHKKAQASMLFQMSPIGGALSGILRLPLAYKLSGRKLLLLLPFHYAFKRLAFCFGFTQAHLEDYGHA